MDINKLLRGVDCSCGKVHTCDIDYVYLEKETEIRKILEEMPASKDISDMLSLVGLDINKFYTLYGKEKINNAILYAKDLKDRYTVLWLNYDLFGDNRNV